MRVFEGGPRVRRVLTWTSAIVLLITGMLATLYLFRGTVIAPRLATFLAEAADTRFGLRLRIGEISGSYIGGLTLADVATRQPSETGSLVSLDVKRLHLSYSLLSLLGGVEAFLAGTTLDLEGAVVAVDLTRKHESAKSSKTVFFPAPASLPRIHIRDTTVRIRGSGYVMDFKGIALETRRRDGAAVTLALEVPEWRWKCPPLKEGVTSVGAEMTYGSKALILTRLDLGKGGFSAHGELGLDGEGRAFPFRVDLHGAGGRAGATGVLKADTLSAQVKTDHMDFSSLSALFRIPGGEVRGILDLEATLELPWERFQDLATDVDLRIAGGAFRGTRIEHLSLHGGIHKGTLRIDTLDLLSEEGQLRLRDAAVPFQVLREGNARDIANTVVGRVTLISDDIPALLRIAKKDMALNHERVPAHRLEFEGSAKGGVLTVSRGVLSTGDGTIRIDRVELAIPGKGRPWPDAPVRAALDLHVGTLDSVARVFGLPAMTGSLTGEVHVSGSLGAPKGNVTLHGHDISYRDFLLGDCTIRAAADTREVSVHSLAVTRGKNRITGRGVLHLPDWRLEGVRLDISIRDLEAFTGEVFPRPLAVGRTWPVFEGELEGTLALHGPLASPDGTASFKGIHIGMGKRKGGRLMARLSKEGNRLEAASLAIRFGGDRLTLQGMYDLSSEELGPTELDLWVGDLKAYTEGLLPEGSSAGGRINARMIASGPMRNPTGRLDLSVGSFHYREIRLEKGRVEARSFGRKIEIQVDELQWSPGTVLHGMATVTRGPEDAFWDVEPAAFSIARNGASLKLTKGGRVRFSRRGAATIQDIVLNGTMGTIRLEGVYSPRGASDLALEVAGLTGKGWLEAWLGDKVEFEGLDARIRLRGSMVQPAIQADGRVTRLGGTVFPVSLSGQFDMSYEKEVLHIRQCDWKGKEGQTFAVEGMLPLDLFGKTLLAPGNLAIRARARVMDLRIFRLLMPREIFAAGQVTGELDMAGTWERPAGSFRFQGRGIELTEKITPLPPGPLDLGGEVTIQGGLMVLHTLRVHSSALTLEGKGQWSGLPSLASLVDHPVLAGEVALEGQLNLPDMRWLARGLAGVRRTAGRLEARIRLKGPVLDPDLKADIRLTDGELGPAAAVPPFSAVNLECQVTAHGIRVQSMTGELGGAPFRVSGYVQRDGRKLGKVDLRVQGENLLFYRDEELKIRADTDIAVRGPLSRLEMSGTVALTDGRFVKDLDLLAPLKGWGRSKTASGFHLFSLTQAPFKDMQFNVRLTSKNPFLIQNNLARGALRPDLFLRGSGETPVLNGVVYVDPTRIRLPAGRLTFESGVIRFLENAPDRPELDINGSSKLLGYDVTVLIKGPLDEPVVTLTSDPPLPNDDLLLLVLTGQPPKSVTARSARERVGMNIAVYLGRDFLGRWLREKDAESEESVLDRFEVDIGRGVTRAGDETIDVRFRLASKVLWQNDTLYLVGEKDIFDSYNTGIKLMFRFK
jgi:hypothetical protein